MAASLRTPLLTSINHDEPEIKVIVVSSSETKLDKYYQEIKELNHDIQLLTQLIPVAKKRHQMKHKRCLQGWFFLAAFGMLSCPVMIYFTVKLTMQYATHKHDLLDQYNRLVGPSGEKCSLPLKCPTSRSGPHSVNPRLQLNDSDNDFQSQCDSLKNEFCDSSVLLGPIFLGIAALGMLVNALILSIRNRQINYAEPLWDEITPKEMKQFKRKSGRHGLLKNSLETLHDEKKKIENLPQYKRSEQRLAFLMGGHEKLGANSPTHFQFFKSPLFDHKHNLTEMIFQFHDEREESNVEEIKNGV